MTTLVLTHAACLDHVTAPDHPECADRLRAVNQVLSEARFDALALSFLFFFLQDEFHFLRILLS